MILPRMEKMVTKVLIMFVLGTNYWFHYCAGKEFRVRPPALDDAELSSSMHPVSLCPHVFMSPGFPVYDYDPSSLREAVSASMAKVNSQSLSPYLFRAFRSSVRRVSAWYVCSSPPYTAFWFFLLSFSGLHVKNFPV